MNRIEAVERRLLATMKQFAGKAATYRRGETVGDLVVVPAEAISDMISFDGPNRYRNGKAFLVGCEDLRLGGAAVEPQAGDVLAYTVDDDAEEYEVTVSQDGRCFEPFGLNKVGVILFTKKLKS